MGVLKMTNFEVTSLFPTPIYHGNSGINSFDNEIEFLNQIEFINAEKNLVSKNTNILDNPALKRCRDICEEHLNNFIDNIFSCEQQFYITNSWVAKSDTDHEHHDHYHPNSILSGVLYLQSYKDSGNIVFYHESPLKKHFSFKYNLKNFNPYNSDMWGYSPLTGEVLIFPSWLRHSVTKNHNNNPRIILGFNTFVKGKFGSNDYSADLIL